MIFSFAKNVDLDASSYFIDKIEENEVECGVD